MTKSSNWLSQLQPIGTTLGAVLLTILVVVLVWRDPSRFGLPGGPAHVESTSNEAEHDHSEHNHSEHDHSEHDHSEHDHPHDEAESIELSDQARRNLGLETQVVTVSSYTEYISIPATIIDWPGRTHVSVAAPLTGVVNAIYVSRGELIRSGQPLFSIRLTHQDLVSTQADFLASLGRLDVEDREIQRLTSITQSGAVAGKTLIQRQYERDRLVAELRAARQAMLLHGLSEEQISEIENERTLIREVTVVAPTLHADDSLHHDSDHHHPSLPPGDVQQASFLTTRHVEDNTEHIQAEFLVTTLEVNRGQSVSAGQMLGRLSDYSQVLIEGHAFQRDGRALRQAANLGLSLQAVIGSASQRPEIVDGLRIIYIDNEVGLESRALPFFVALDNQIERNERRGEQRYVSWRFKPGQRLQLRVPLQGFDNTLVVPKDAVAEEGFERYIFVEQGGHFDRRPVQVLARDAIWAAIANDGSVRPGQSIAIRGAHQLQMAIKNKSGGPIDPHAGHSH